MKIQRAFTFIFIYSFIHFLIFTEDTSSLYPHYHLIAAMYSSLPQFQLWFVSAARRWSPAAATRTPCQLPPCWPTTRRSEAWRWMGGWRTKTPTWPPPLCTFDSRRVACVCSVVRSSDQRPLFHCRFFRLQDAQERDVLGILVSYKIKINLMVAGGGWVASSLSCPHRKVFLTSIKTHIARFLHSLLGGLTARWVGFKHNVQSAAESWRLGLFWPCGSLSTQWCHGGASPEAHAPKTWR